LRQIKIGRTLSHFLCAQDPDEDVELLTQEWLNELKDPEICVRGIAGARLQYVIFDILVSEGKSCHDKMHWERMVSLNNVWASHLLKSPGTHLRLSYNSTTDKDSPSPVVRTYEELQKHLEYSIIHKTEVTRVCLHMYVAICPDNMKLISRVV
jgi:hypothetical protein